MGKLRGGCNKRRIMTPLSLLIVTALAASSSLAAPLAASSSGAAVTVPEATLPPLDPRCRRSLPEEEQPHVANLASDVEMIGGGMAFSIPVPLPNGPGSLKPDLSIEYTSSGPEGNLGIGFKIGATSVISRCSKTLAQDDKIEGVKLVETDAFCLDGTRLVLIKGNHSKPLAEYRTETESFSRVVARGRLADGPESFTIETKDLQKMTFGGKSAARIKTRNNDGAPKPENNGAVIIGWALSKTEDRFGNVINYDYGEEMELKSISYGTTEVHFEYEKRPDESEAFMAGNLVSKRTQRLSSFTIWNNKVVLFKYKFKYDAEGFGGSKRSLLNSVEVCDRNDKCVHPMEFSYEGSVNLQPKFSLLGESSGRVSVDFGFNQGWRIDSHERFVEDIDGDGWADVVGFANGGVFVGVNKRDGTFEKGKYVTTEFGSGSGWGKEYPRHLADIDGDGLPDIVGFASSGLLVAFNKGGLQFEKAVNLGAMFHYGAGWRVDRHPRYVMDINGDGRADVVGFANAGVYVALSKGRTMDSHTQWIGSYGYSNGWRNDKHIRTLADVNGDGLLDVVGFGETSVYVSLNDGSSFQAVQVWITNRFAYSPEGWRVNEHLRFVEDINGDGMADIVGFSCCGVIVSLSDGKKFQKPTYWTSEFGSRIWSQKDHPRTLRDVSGDGLPDIVGFANSGIYVAINQGKSFAKSTQWIQGFGKSSGWQTGSHPRLLTDITGDGVADVVGFASSGVYSAKGENTIPRMTCIQDSFFAKRKIVYESLPSMLKAGLYKRISAPSYPSKTEVLPIPIVKSISLEGVEGAKINETNYEYEGIEMNVLGRGLLGFRSILSKPSASNVYVKEMYNMEYPLTGSIREKSIHLNENGKDIQISSFSNYFETKQLAVKHILLTSTVFKKNDEKGDSISTMTTEYAEYDEKSGMFAKINSASTGDDDKGYQVETKNTLQSDEKAWTLGVLTKSVVKHESENLSVTKSMNFVYELSKGIKVKQIQAPNSDLMLETEYSHDKFGNVIQVVESPQGNRSESRESKMFYDTNGIQMVSRSNALGHSETFTHDDMGNVIQSIGPNGIESKWDYNGIGKLIGEYRADGTKSNWHYQWSNVDGENYRLVKEVQGFSTETEVYDLHDRMIRKITVGMKGNNIFEDIVYNERGFIAKRSLPYFEGETPILWTKYDFDNFDRLIAVKNPKGSGGGEILTKYSYDGLSSTEVDPLGNSKVTKRDVLGRIISVTDAVGGQSRYKYDPVGNILEIINPSGHRIITTYDLMGRKLTLNDLHMGKWSYKHNVFGELVWQKDSIGNEIFQEFDKLGRKTLKKDKDGKSGWTYDGKNGIGKVSMEKSHGMTKKWNYDIFGREDSVVTTIKEDKYEIENVYDDFGRLIVQKFPNGREVHRCYNENGYLLRVQKFKCSIRVHYFWEAQNYDPLGRVTEEKQGNGITTTYNYDLAANLVQIKSIGKDGDTIVRNVEYEYDENHNLKKRSKPDTIESFRYDSLDRLIRATLRTRDGKFGRTENWGFDPSGNIVYDNKFGQRHFEYYPDKPHAVKKAGDNTYSYDSNGNIIDRNGMKIEWTPDNKPKSFKYTNKHTEKEDRLTYLYDGEGFRFLKYHGDSTTLNIGHLYEEKKVKDSITTSIFIYAHKVGSLVATMKKTNAEPETVDYIHTDHLGSVEMITNEDGSVNQHLCYTSFGHRMPCNPSQSTQIPPPSTTKGFTGHDHVEVGGLIHMNGRVYDPEIGRFLSPDPHIQDMYDTQSLNRYSYARNNPLKYDDPSGFFFKRIKKWVKKAAKFVKKNWRPIVAVVATVATAGALSGPAAALVAGAGLSGTTATVAAGALAGAGGGFVGGTISTGSINGGLKGALGGAITGGVAAGFADMDGVSRIFAKATGGGVSAEVTGGDFKDGFIQAGVSAGAKYLYNQVVGYDSEWKPGGAAKVKGEFTRPYEGLNNIGVQGQGRSIDTSWLNKATFLNVKEGGGLSRMLNRVPGINAVAGMHDVFQISMDRVLFTGARDYLNVPGMPVAAALTYASLLDSDTLGLSHYQAMMVDESRKRK